MNIDFNAGKKINKISEDEEKEEIIKQDEEEPVEENIEPPKSSYNKSDLKKQMVKIFSILIGIFFVILIVILLLSVFSTKKYTYDDVELEMKRAAKAYFSDHQNQLPNAGNISKLPVQNLIDGEYMKPIHKYLGDSVTCDGWVSVERIENTVSFSPYLDCGKDYKTIEFYKKLTDSKNIVKEGYGLYTMNSSYVYRGENINNYVQLDKALWRIVKIKSNGYVQLILSEPMQTTRPWDDRYNKITDFESGINNYTTSRVKELITSIYNNKYVPDEEYEEYDYKFVSKKDKEKIVPVTICVGKRGTTDQSKNNSVECAATIKNQYVTLLTASDYLNASTDPNCRSTVDRTCGNYNYLKLDNVWWLLTAVKNDTSQAYMVDTDGSIISKNCSNYAKVRPVITLNNTALYKSGKGTLEKPYIIK